MASVTLNEGKFPGEFLASQANGTQSKDVVTLVQQSAVVLGATVMGIVTATGKYTPHAPAASDGSQNAAGILYANTDATGGDVNTLMVRRNCEVNGGELIWAAGITTNQKNTAIAALAALGIIVRTGV